MITFQPLCILFLEFTKLFTAQKPVHMLFPLPEIIAPHPWLFTSSYPSFDLSLQCYFHKEALADLHSFFFFVDPCSFLSWPWLHSIIMHFVIAAPLSLASVCGLIFLVPRPGIEPMMPAMEVWNANHWPAKEVPISALFKMLISFTRI